MPTFQIVVPVTAVLAVEGSPSTVTVVIHGDVASVTITTSPAVVTPPTPTEYWQHDTSEDGIPGWNGDAEPAPTVWPYDPDEWVREPVDEDADENADEPPPASNPFYNHDPEAENDPWLGGR